MPDPRTLCPVGVVLLWSCLTVPAWSQDVQLLDCAQVQFFGPACVPAVAMPQGQQLSPPPPQEEPLFRPETMAPDTPPLLLKLLEQPSVENARAFVTWQHKRTERITEVQQLLRALIRDGTP
jgi:hypothetical protein